MIDVTIHADNRLMTVDVDTLRLGNGKQEIPKMSIAVGDSETTFYFTYDQLSQIRNALSEYLGDK